MLFQLAGQEDRFESFETMYGIRNAVSDAAGEFVLVGVPVKATNVMADHPDLGRSLAANVPEGTDDPPPMTLQLRGYGSITGKVTLKGQPQANVTVGDSSKGGGAAATFAQTGVDGVYMLAKVPEGAHVLNALRQQMMSLKSTSVTVNVVAGQQAIANIDIPVGTITLSVQVKALPGNTVDGAQVFLFAAPVSVQNAKQLTDSLFQSSIQGMKIWLGKAFPPPEFDELVAGSFTLCTVPITGNMSDPTFLQRLQANATLLKVYCKPIQITPTPNAQTVVHEVPSMTPLPPPS
jgi:hypothetical protein